MQHIQNLNQQGFNIPISLKEDQNQSKMGML